LVQVDPYSHLHRSLVPGRQFEVMPSAKQRQTKHSNGRLRKTTMCHFYDIGKCRYGHDGDKCPFAHSPEELFEQPDLKKSHICHRWKRGRCKHSAEECVFAHGKEDLRKQSVNRTPSQESLDGYLTDFDEFGLAFSKTRSASSRLSVESDDGSGLSFGKTPSLPLTTSESRDEPELPWAPLGLGTFGDSTPHQWQADQQTKIEQLKAHIEHTKNAAEQTYTVIPVHAVMIPVPVGIILGNQELLGRVHPHVLMSSSPTMNLTPFEDGLRQCNAKPHLLLTGPDQFMMLGQAAMSN